jgi:hypothetical protein
MIDSEDDAMGFLRLSVYCEFYKQDGRKSMLAFKRFFTTIYLMLSVGVTWAAMTQDRVNYPSWALVGPAEFGNFHHAVLVGTQTYIIPFALLTLPMGLAMIWLRHPAISRGLVIFVLAIGLFGGAITTRLAIPIQKEMLHGDPGDRANMVQKLIDIDLRWRFFPGLLALGALSVMVYQLTGARASEAE